MHRIEQIRNRETNVETWFITSLFLSRPNFITSLFIVSQFYHIPISPYPYVISFWHPIIRLSCHLSPISQFPLTPTLKKKNQKNRIPPLIRALLRFYSDKRILFSEGNCSFPSKKSAAAFGGKSSHIRTCEAIHPYALTDDTDRWGWNQPVLSPKGRLKSCFNIL